MIKRKMLKKFSNIPAPVGAYKDDGQRPSLHTGREPSGAEHAPEGIGQDRIFQGQHKPLDCGECRLFTPSDSSSVP